MRTFRDMVMDDTADLWLDVLASFASGGSMSTMHANLLCAFLSSCGRAKCHATVKADLLPVLAYLRGNKHLQIPLPWKPLVDEAMTKSLRVL